MEKQIGWFHLKEDKVFTNLFQYAAYLQNVLVPAGTYPIHVDRFHALDRKGTHWDNQIGGEVYIVMHGKITYEYFGDNIPQDVGGPGRHTMRPYMFEISDSILHDPDTPYELFPEYEAREIEFQSPVDGRMLISHQIYLVKESEEE